MPGNPFQGPMSEPQTPQPRTRMRTSPSPGSGVSRDSIRNWRGSIRIADRMVLLAKAPSPRAGGRGRGRGGMGSNLPRRPQQRTDRLAVVNLAADRLVHSVFQGKALQLDHLILVEALAGLLEPFAEEEPD